MYERMVEIVRARLSKANTFSHLIGYFREIWIISFRAFCPSYGDKMVIVR